MIDTKKRIAFVTGANRGIGFEVCKELAQNDIDVILKNIIYIFVLVCFLGCEKSLVTGRYDEHAAASLMKICSQRDSEQAQTPHYFKVTPVEAIELSKPYFIENPFELTVFADAQNYYVDLSTLGMNARKAGSRGVVIDGRTGEIIRGNPRVIGK